MIKAGIVGGAGYTGGELLRILLDHPFIEISYVQSRSQSGVRVHEVHPGLAQNSDLVFVNDSSMEIDVMFMCLGHGEAQEFLRNNRIDNTVKIIDLSQDFRLGSPKDRFFNYGLPEVNREIIRKSKNIANPGCFATAIQLTHLPLSQKKMLNSPLHASAITGSTGAGQSLSPTSHFSWRYGNISVYKAFRHQHLDEIRMVIGQLQENKIPDIHMLPFRGSFTRGILSAVYTQSELTIDEAMEIYHDYYRDHPFVTLSNKNPDVKQVVNTNNAILYLQKEGENLLIVSVIDNLLKGASGQAVQNANLMFGFEEDAGLRLKASVF
jgi:N-acetyl-gamma-glutamyl-phosphate reductase